MIVCICLCLYVDGCICVCTCACMSVYMKVCKCRHTITSLSQQSVEILQKLFDKFVAKVLEFRRRSCKELIPTSQLNAVISLCKLYDTLATPENGVSFYPPGDEVSSHCCR